ncbi:MAG: divergent polysaccharide deacetylase family protein [Desulfarculales bacterium]|jgi:polysaccharide deacetylase 2 family uncharacterized protein YibQ|nr:divergent polysaccharide deacetylase family protein [Desulfarculales bacterium]
MAPAKSKSSSPQPRRVKKPAAAVPSRSGKSPGKPGRSGAKNLVFFFLGLGMAIGLACAGAGAYLLFFSSPAPPPRPEISPPGQAAPQEVYHYEEPAGESWLRLDRAIYEALRGAGVAAGQSESWTDIKEHGETARLEIELTPRQSLTEVAERLNKELRPAGAGLSWQKQTGFWHLEIYLDSQLTHQINLRQTEENPSLPLPPPGPGKPRAAIIVDDVGLNKNALSQLLALDLPLTMSVLPYAPDAPRAARQIKERGFELWLHLPMEPLGGSNPGPGALYSHAGQEALISLTRQALTKVPGAVGVNNHMGSRFTQNAAALAGPLQVIRENNLLFLDSLTSPRSVAQAEAGRLGIKSGRRDIFLDHQIDEESIERQLRNLVNLARRQGQAIAICHPHSATIKVLRQNQAWLKNEVEMVFASQLIK